MWFFVFFRLLSFFHPFLTIYVMIFKEINIQLGRDVNMSNYQFFKIKPDTEFYRAVQKHFTLLPKWNAVYDKVSELLGETITKIGYSTNEIILDVSELTKEENLKLFKKDGTLKANLKKSKELIAKYQEIIKEAGLTEYQELRFINFAYGVMRSRGQSLESYRTSQNETFYKADFNLEKKTGGLVIPISELEYQETYLNELKKQAENEAAVH